MSGNEAEREKPKRFSTLDLLLKVLADQGVKVPNEEAFRRAMNRHFTVTREEAVTKLETIMMKALVVADEIDPDFNWSEAEFSEACYRLAVRGVTNRLDRNFRRLLEQHGIVNAKVENSVVFAHGEGAGEMPPTALFELARQPVPGGCTNKVTSPAGQEVPCMEADPNHKGDCWGEVHMVGEKMLTRICFTNAREG